MCCSFGKKKEKDKSSKIQTVPTKSTTKTVTGGGGGNIVTAIPKEQTSVPEPEAAAEKGGKEAKPLTQEVINVMKNFIDETCKKGIDGLKKEFDKLGNPPKPTQSHDVFLANGSKNRYTNIPCYDKTRIVLKYQVPPETDYIHANRIVSKIADLKSNFICTQGPTPHTINDFWRMVWQEKPKYIVMLCKTKENNKIKCAQYWPVQQGDKATYGSIEVTNEGNDGGKEKDTVFDIEKLIVSADGKEIVVKQIRWLDWPDFGIPQTGLGMLRLLRKIDQDSGTAIVHCSAGIGRSGTLLAAEILMKALTSGKQVKVIDILKELRDQRFGLIQTQGQYCYLHLSIFSYIERKIDKEPDAQEILARIKQFLKSYKEYAAKEENYERDHGRTETGK